MDNVGENVAENRNHSNSPMVQIVVVPQVSMALVGAKSRVAPLKLVSIPRLELEACVLPSIVMSWDRIPKMCKIGKMHL